MSRKTQFILLITIAVVIIGLAAGVFAVYLTYDRTNFSQTSVFEENYSYRNGILYANEKDSAMLYNPTGGAFEKFEPQEIDLSAYSLTGAFRYYLIDNTIVPIDEKYNFFYASNGADRFIYIDADGKKYAINTTDNSCLPLFDGSDKDIDPYAADIDAASANGCYFVDFGEEAFTFYCREKVGDTAISELKTVEYTEDMGEGIPDNLGFINNDTLFFRSNGRYFICSASGAEIADCYINDDVEYKKEAISRHFIEEIIPEEEQNSEQNKSSLIIRYDYLFSGNSFEIRLDRALYSDATLVAVSPNGLYAVLNVTAAENASVASGLMVYKIGERYESLAATIPETVSAKDITFIYNNILFINYPGNSKSYKICF